MEIYKCLICNKYFWDKQGQILNEYGKFEPICNFCLESRELSDNNKYGHFEEKVSKLLIEIITLLGKKRHDYGDSFERIWDMLGPRSVLPRLFDKLFRLKSLLGKKEEKNEKIEDTFKDIIGYCILSILKLRGKI